MGLVRLLLAVAVVGTHAWGPTLVGGRVAVEFFYVISGFLISYIVIERNAYPTIRAFWASRFLRLYPTYFVVAAGALVIAIALWKTGNPSPVIETFQAAPAAPSVFLAVTNSTLFFQDATMFMGVHDGTWQFASDFRDSSPQLWRGLLIPPAWSLGVEIAFYVVAPLVLRSRIAIVALIVASVAARFALTHVGLGSHDPWTYRFFPTELVFFLLGAVAHQYLRPLWRRLPDRVLIRLAPVAVGVVAVGFVAFFHAPGTFTMRALALLALFVAVLPLLFEFRPRGNWDRYVGELSYPLYLCHYPLILGLAAVLARWGIDRGTFPFFAIALALSLAVAAILTRTITGPVDRRRHRLRRAAVADQ